MFTEGLWVGRSIGHFAHVLGHRQADGWLVVGDELGIQRQQVCSRRVGTEVLAELSADTALSRAVVLARKMPYLGHTLRQLMPDSPGRVIMERLNEGKENGHVFVVGELSR